MPESIRRKPIHHEIPKTDGINITPLIDVVFQLLIFFMVASSLIKPNQIELDLPNSTSGAKSQQQPDALTVTYRVVDGQPEITFNEGSIDSLQALQDAMRQLKAAGDQQAQQVDVMIDKTVPYQDVIALIDAVRDAGFPKFSLLTLMPGQVASRPAGTSGLAAASPRAEER